MLVAIEQSDPYAAAVAGGGGAGPTTGAAVIAATGVLQASRSVIDTFGTLQLQALYLARWIWRLPVRDVLPLVSASSLRR